MVAALRSSRLAAKAAQVAGALLLFVLAGCGRHAADNLPHLVVASQKGGAKAMMMASGVLEGAPFTVEWADFPSAGAAVGAIDSGAVDTTAVGEQPFLVALAAGSSAKVIDLMQTQSGGRLLALIVPRGSKIHAVADLKGKRIATTRGSSGHYFLDRVLEQAGIARNDIHAVFLSPADAKAAFIGGSVDAWATWDPYLAIAQLQDGARIVIDGQSLSKGFGLQLASPAALAAKRTLLADFVARWHRAEAWAVAHPEQYAQTWSAETGLPAAVARQSLLHIQTTPVAFNQGAVAEIQADADRLARYGMLARPVDVSGIFDLNLVGANHAGIAAHDLASSVPADARKERPIRASRTAPRHPPGWSGR